MKLILIFSVLLLGSGCSFFQTQIGEGTTYQYGKLQGMLNDDLEDADAATIKAVKKMKLLLVTHKNDAFYSVFEAKNAKDQDVVIELEKTSDSSTKVVIKVGFTGDRPFSQALYDTIKDHL